MDCGIQILIQPHKRVTHLKKFIPSQLFDCIQKSSMQVVQHPTIQVFVVYIFRNLLRDILINTGYLIIICQKGHFLTSGRYILR